MGGGVVGGVGWLVGLWWVVGGFGCLVCGVLGVL